MSFGVEIVLVGLFAAWASHGAGTGLGQPLVIGVLALLAVGLLVQVPVHGWVLGVLAALWWGHVTWRVMTFLEASIGITAIITALVAVLTGAAHCAVLD